jgi:hypothetical protein
MQELPSGEKICSRGRSHPHIGCVNVARFIHVRVAGLLELPSPLPGSIADLLQNLPSFVYRNTRPRALVTMSKFPCLSMLMPWGARRWDPFDSKSSLPAAHDLVGRITAGPTITVPHT